MLCLYLKSHPDESLIHDTHYIDRSEAFFTNSPFDNTLMWKNHIEACLNTKNPSTTLIPKEENSIKHHFGVVRAKRKRGRPKKGNKKSTPPTNNNSISPRHEKKSQTQSSMKLYFSKEASSNEESENEDNLIPETVSHAPNN